MRTFYEEWKCLDANLADASAKLDSEGKLAAYLRVLDDEERIEGENPSVGIVLCKDADRAYVEYVLQDYIKPMGVATYKSGQERLRELLPDEEEIKKLL